MGIIYRRVFAFYNQGLIMQRSFADVIIPISGDTSAATVIPSGFTLAGVITPAALDGANLSILGAVSSSPTSYQPVYNGGTAYSVAMGTNRFIALDTKITQGIAAFQLKSDSTEAAARTFQAVYIKDR